MQELNALNKRLRDVYCDCLRLTEQARLLQSPHTYLIGMQIPYGC